ncbi:GNAT family N-acetyltransferase [Hyphobacterium sp.]|jgi:ribosomal protein S18 acetylase RimI-like enzyme|uniref:GNAT family N-acetyltransferase n=1 Tax=Hyphobacterium sp. TaxID=2004662 RepID=UPI003BA99565
MAFALRPASSADLDALTGLEARAFAPADRFPRRNLRRLLASTSAWLGLCESAGAAAGSVIVLFREGSRVARLYSLAVDPAFAGRGVGRALISAAAEEARQRGCLWMRLEVRASNVRAVALYERSGFRLRDTKKDYYADGEAAQIYERALEGDPDLK